MKRFERTREGPDQLAGGCGVVLRRDLYRVVSVYRDEHRDSGA